MIPGPPATKYLRRATHPRPRNLSTNTGGKTAAENAAISGKLMTAGLDEIALKSHPEKTCQIVVGKKEFREKTKKEMLEKNPTFIQGTKTRLSTEDKLLGIFIIEGTLDEIIMYADNYLVFWGFY